MPAAPDSPDSMPSRASRRAAASDSGSSSTTTPDRPWISVGQPAALGVPASRHAIVVRLPWIVSG